MEYVKKEKGHGNQLKGLHSPNLGDLKIKVIINTEETGTHESMLI